MIDKVSAHLHDPVFCISTKCKHRKLVPITYPQFQRRLRILISYTGRDEDLIPLTHYVEVFVLEHLNLKLNQNLFSSMLTGFLIVIKNI